jgi:uncharacterized RmlC-like cupin family protein
VPPAVPHREENPDTDDAAVIVTARSRQYAMVVNLPALYALSDQPTWCAGVILARPIA